MCIRDSGSGGSYVSALDGTIVSSSTSNTVSDFRLISGGTYTTGNLLRIGYLGRKTGTTATFTMRIYVNTVPNLTGTPILLGTAVSAANSRMLGMERRIAIKSNTVTQTFSSITSAFTDISVTTVAETNSNIDWSVDQYFIFALQNGSASDTTVSANYSIEKLN
jgi:hypothetical protein